MTRQSPIFWKNIIFSILFVFFYSACNHKKANVQGSAYYASLAAVMVRNQHFEDSSHFFYTIDSAFGSSAWGRYYGYSFKREYFVTYKKDFIKASLYADSILAAIADEQSDPDYLALHAQALLYKGEALLTLHQPDDGIAAYYQAREDIFKTKDTCLFNAYSSRLGLTAYKQKKYKEAIEYFKQGFLELQNCTESVRVDQFLFQQAHLDNIGLCYSKMGFADSALFYYDSTLRYIEKFKQHSDTAFTVAARAVVYGNKAQVLLDKGEDSLAEQLLKESIRINSLPSHAVEDIPYSLAKLANLYIKQLRMAEAWQALQQLKAQLDLLPNAEMKERWAELSALYFETKGDFTKAYQFIKQYSTAKDSSYAASQSLATTDLDKEFANLKNQYSVISLERKNKLQSLYLVIIILAASMGTVILVLVWRNYKQGRKHIEELEELNGIVKIRNEYLQESLSALQKSHEDNSRVMQVVAHDLRNPIGAISMLADAMLLDENYTPDQQKELSMIHKTSGSSLKLIDDILHANITVHNIEKRPVNLKDLLQFNADMLRIKASEKKQKIILHAKDVNILGDGEKLWRVFNNIIFNAIKFSPQNTTITVQLYEDGKNAIVSVADQGVGIPDELRDKLFDATADVKRRGTAGEASFGFGLAICKEIVEAHGGHIWADANIGTGTVFYISLPRE